MDLLQSSAKMKKSDVKAPDISLTDDSSFQSTEHNVKNIEVVEAKEWNYDSSWFMFYIALHTVLFNELLKTRENEIYFTVYSI